jgi:Winged helix-turn-helix DNA-binding
MSPASITKIRSDREARARRHLELVKLLRENPNATNIELAEVLNVSRNTIAEDRKFLMSQATNEAQSEMQLYREDQLTRIQEKWDEIESDDTMTGAEKHLAWSRWMKLEMDLRGTAAPSKSIHANVSTNPEHSAEYLLFREACAGLNDDQLHEVYAMAKALPRTWVAPPIEADFPVRMLPEATDDAC